jgi:hypothetical protein
LLEDPGPVASEVVTVGSKYLISDSGWDLAAARLACDSRVPGDLKSLAVAVGSKDEDSETSVRGSHVGSSKTAPFRIEPEVGQVSEYTAECPKAGASGFSQTSLRLFHFANRSGTKGSFDVFPDNIFRLYYGDAFAHGFPQIGSGTVLHAAALAGEAQVLAGRTAADDVYGFDVGPVDFRDVAVVRDCRPVVGEYLGRGGLPFGNPCEFGAENFLYCHAESAVAGEQFAEA